MTSAEEIITIYKSNVDDHVSGIDEIIANEKKLQDEKKNTSTVENQTTATLKNASQQRKKLLDDEIANLSKLQQAKKSAFTVKEIEDYNKKIQQSESNIKTLESSTQKTSSTLQTSFKQLGTAIVAAFAIQNVIAFGKESIKMFAESQKAQLQLLAALNGQEDVQKRLIQQADELQEKFGIDNDTIVAQQAFLAIQGRTEAQIKKTIQAAIALSAVTKDDLPSSIQKLDATFEGNIGRLGKLDERFKNLTPTQLANGAAIDLVNEKYTKFAEQGALSVSTQLEIQQRRVDDLKKKIGSELSPTLLELNEVGLKAADGLFTLAGGASSLAVALGQFAGQNAFGAQFKKLQEQFKVGLSTKSIEELILRSRELSEIQSKLTGEARTKSLAERQAILEELQLRGRANTEIKKEVETLESLKSKLEQLQKTQESIADPLGKGKAQNDSLVKQIADTQNKIDEITGKAAEDRRKKQEEINKQSEQDSLNALKKKIADNTEAAKNANEIDLANLDTAKQKELASEETSVDEKLVIDRKYLELKAKLFSDDPVMQAKIGAEIAAIDTKLAENKISNAKATDDALVVQSEDSIARQLKLAQDAEKRKQEIIRASFELIQEFDSLILQLSQARSNERISVLEAEKEKELTSIDEELLALESQHDKRRISDKRFEADSAALKRKRVEEEKKINEQINAEKRKQAQITKQIAVFEAGLNFSKALIAALTIAPPASFVAEAITAAIAGVQLASVIAAPIPKFEYGKRDRSRAGLSMVGERGIEIINLPDESQVLPTAKYYKNKEFINAMFDDELDKLINQQYVLPALIAQKRKYEESQGKSFAENVANSFLLNSRNAGLDEYGMARALEKGATIRNVHELADAIAKKTNSRYSANM